MTAFAGALLDAAHAHATSVAAWVVLPNHYHMVVATAQLSALVTTLGQLHGRTSRKWNSEENRRGRQVWCKCAETGIKSLDHLRATLNYVHHNPVKHGYVKRWTDWHWSSAGDYVAEVGREEAARLWREYPITEYGHGWDDAEM
jgi:putative transposase